MFKKPFPVVAVPVEPVVPVVPEISIQAVNERITHGDLKKFRFIDVRSTEDYNKVHILGIEHREQDRETHAINTDGLNKDDEIIISCQSGRRSAFVTEYLSNAGFKNVKSMHGGINAWIQAGFGIESKFALKMG